MNRSTYWIALAILILSAVAAHQCLAQDRDWTTSPNSRLAALAKFSDALDCHLQTPSHCSQHDCAEIGKNIDWLGALCRASEDRSTGDREKLQTDISLAFELFQKSLSEEQREGLKGDKRYQAVLSNSEAGGTDAKWYFLELRALNEKFGLIFRTLEDEDESEAAKLLEKAKAGAAEDQLAYADAIWGRHDEESIIWTEKAAKQGHVKAQATLGWRYRIGSIGPGAKADPAKAFKWYRKAAEQGDLRSQMTIGFAFLKGDGVKKDASVGAYWIGKAADQGDADSQRIMGFLYSQGEGVPQDLKKAFVWFDKAAAQGDSTAQFQLGLHYLLSSDEESGDEQAALWFEKSATQGNTEAQKAIGKMYLFGRGVSVDLPKAASWVMKAAEQKDPEAQLLLAELYIEGKGVSQDDAAATGWLRKAADQGLSRAENFLGTFYEKGRGGLLQDHTQAASWYEKSAKQGDGYGQANLARLYRDGRGVAKSGVIAYAWMNLAAANGIEAAMKERDSISTSLRPSELQKAQDLSRSWKNGESITE